MRIMRQLSSSQYKWLKAFHVLFSALWTGAAVSLLFGQFWLKAVPEIPPLWALKTLDFIDWFVLVPGATGVVLTGVLFSLTTQWGWGKDYYWIRAKWFIAIGGVIIGTFYLAPWMHDLIEQSLQSGIEVYSQKSFLELWSWLIFWAILQVFALLYAVWLSIFKPK